MYEFLGGGTRRNSCRSQAALPVSIHIPSGRIALRWCRAVVVTFFLSVGQAHSQPADESLLGAWNGYREQQNIVECINASSDAAEALLVIIDHTGRIELEHAVTFSPFSSLHVDLSTLTPIENRYGTLRLSARDGVSRPPATLSCGVSTYRFDAAAAALDFAYHVPISSPLTGESAGIFNPMNPSTSAPRVENWLSLSNAGSSPLAFTLELRSVSGVLRRAVSLEALPAGARRDLLLEGDGAPGLYRLIPEDPEARYGALLTRYGAGGDGGSFALAAPAGGRQCDEAPLMLSTIGPAQGWIEVANAGAREAALTVKIFDPAGALRAERPVRLAAFSQLHLSVNELLGEGAVGYAVFECGGDAVLFAHSLSYGRSFSEEAIAWAFRASVSERTRGGETLSVPLNTYLGAANWLKLINTGAEAAPYDLALFDQEGQENQRSLRLLADGTEEDLAFHELLGPDRVGSASLSAPGAPLAATLLRVYPHPAGGIAAVMHVPPGLSEGAAPEAALEPYVSGLNAPVFMTHAGDGSNRLYVVERAGRIRVIENGRVGAVFLDLRGRVSLDGERGMHSLAFAPDFEQSRTFYVHYNDLDGDTVVSRFLASSGFSAEHASEEVVFTTEQPHEWHNGGQLAFGPDGMLYLGLGDGGFSGDPLDHGQDLATVLGSILRLDVSGDGPASAPADNPFTATPGAAPEIWAYGFRNPWRFSFDRSTGRLFAADVGQSVREEIDLVLRGGNYGWRTMEGSLCFFPQTGCDRSGLELPLTEYSHEEGVAVIGGYVYRGTRYPQFFGRYFFADYAASTVWMLSETSPGVWRRSTAHESPTQLFISSFAEDEGGELYVIDIQGTIYRLTGTAGGSR